MESLKKVQFLLIFGLVLLLPLELFGQVPFSSLVDISLEAVLRTGFLGVPTGLENPGREAYLDFESQTLSYVPYGNPPPKDWDLLFSYSVREISLGPLGRHPVPFMHMKSNSPEWTLETGSDERESNDFYEFPAGQRLQYELPKGIFILKASDGQRIEISFDKLEGLMKNNELFSTQFHYRERKE
jgi:hypothetical protein